MEKKTIKTRFLAGVLALTMAGSTTSALALEKSNDKAGQTVEITETMLDEETKKLKEALGEEYYSFLQSIGVEVVNGNLNVTTAEQFKAIGDYYNGEIEKIGYKTYDVCTELFILNYDFISDDLKQELADKKIISNDNFKIYDDYYNNFNADNHDIEFDKRSNGEIFDNFQPKYMLMFCGDAIVTASKIHQYVLNDYKGCLENKEKEHIEFTEQFGKYLRCLDNDLDLMPIKELAQPYLFITENYYSGIITYSFLFDGFSYSEEFSKPDDATFKLERERIIDFDKYINKVIKRFPQPSKIKVKK